MSKSIVREQTIASTTRRGTSVNGNPSYDVVFTDGSAARTAPDAMVAYGITNAEYRDPAAGVHVTYERGMVVGVSTRAERERASGR